MKMSVLFTFLKKKCQEHEPIQGSSLKNTISILIKYKPWPYNDSYNQENGIKTSNFLAPFHWN